MSNPPASGATWADAQAYEAYMGRWSAAVASRFLGLLGPEPGRRWLDVGCGTGILTRAILVGTAPASVVGIDPSEPFVAHARATTDDARASFRIATADDTGLADGAVDAVVYGLVLNNIPDVAAALAEARRVSAPGGVIAGYVWDYADGMELIRSFWDVAVPLDPAAEPFDQRRRFPITARGALGDAFSAAGLLAVAEDPIEIPTTFPDFDDLWRPFTGGTGHAPLYLASLEPDRRDDLRERFRRSLPIEPDGSIRLTARAWACRGRTPGSG